MKAFLKCGFCLTLGLMPTTLWAQELQWRPTGGTTVPGAAPSIGLSRPTPLNDPAPLTVSPLKPIVRAQNPDDKPLPLGPLGDGKNPSPAPITGGQQPDKPGQKVGEFIAPPPKTSKSPAVMPSADCCPPSPACPCPEKCGLFGCGILGCPSLFGHDGWLSHLWEPGCNPCNPCCDRPSAWVSADYLYWTIRSSSLPPLVTTSPVGTPIATAGTPVAGALGQPTTSVLFDRFDDPWRSGFRVSGGYWFHKDGCWGIDASFWSLGSWTQSFVAGGNGNAIIARPLTDITTGTPVPSAELVAYPGVVNGAVSVTSRHELWGAEADLRRKLWCGPNGFLDALVGYRHFWLSEGLNITESLTPLAADGVTPLGTNIVSDRFSTSNNFNGLQLGLAGEWRAFQTRWTLAGSVRVGLGDMHQVVDIQGNQFFNIPPVPPSVQNGGILALPTNIGHRSADRFAVIPEVGLKLGYDLTPHLRLYVGYDFMYVSSVVRPGDQIDLAVNRTQIPTALGPSPLVGVARPAPQFNATDFWVQGFNVGLLWRY
jgi:hypothetical protein